MENFIKYVKINNFKSINELKLEDCRRINLFIGYPNVGKSNVLEALRLFSVPYCLEEGENLNKLIRVENKYELLYNPKYDKSFVNTNLGNVYLETDDRDILKIKLEKKQKKLSLHFFNEMDNLFLQHIIKTNNNYDCNNHIIPYIFQLEKMKENVLTFDTMLFPPFGENILITLLYNKNIDDVRKWIKNEFAKHKLELVLDKSSNSLKVQKRLDDDEVLQLPYSSLADTLQRVIFYKTAVASNKNSVLLFEEPEAHAFPPYIQTIMQDIIDAESNQFFIVTHSPLVVNAFLEYEKLRQETSIYVFDYKNDQTTAKRLSDEEMELAYEYGDDIFFNIENLL